MLQAFRLIWQCDRKSLLFKVFYTVCTSLLPLANLYILKVLVDSVTSYAGSGFEEFPQMLVYCILAFCGITLLNRLISVLSTVNNDILTQKLIDYINNLIQNQLGILRQPRLPRYVPPRAPGGGIQADTNP